MNKLSKEVKQQLKSLGLRAKRSRGQNFLIDPFVLSEIATWAGTLNPAQFNHVVEIGPGLGALTQMLCSAKALSLIEIQEEFCQKLRSKFPSANIINEDVRFFDLSSLGLDLMVYGNLPYSFSTDIVFTLIKHRRSISRAILLLQDEFAARMAAAPGSRTYGALSIACQLHAKVELGSQVSGDRFSPPTEVTSRMISLSFSEESINRVSPELEAVLKLVLKASFSKRRRKLLNSLKSLKPFKSCTARSPGGHQRL